MKINYFKAVSIMTVLFALGGSLVTYSSEKHALAPVTGYISKFGSPCSINVTCNSSGSVACTAVLGGSSYYAFGKLSPYDTVCDVFLYKKF